MPVQIKRLVSKTKERMARPLYAQILVVVLAFALMVVLSYRFMGDIEHKHLIHDVNNTIQNTQAEIVSNLREPEMALNIIAEHIRHMILEGDSADLVLKYLKETCDYLLTDERLKLYVNAIYGSFDVFDGEFLVGIDWKPPDDYVPSERPWHKAAVAAKGKVGAAQPYIDARLGVVIVSFARCIFADDGSQLGVICMDVSLDMIKEIAVNTYVTKGSYGVLIDQNFMLIAHPHPAYIGRALRDMNDGAAIEAELRQGNDVTERKATDYQGNTSILFFRQLENGWYMGIMAYAKDYYQSVKDIARILSVLGIVLAAILSAILVRIVIEKQRSDERMQTMFDAMPLGANFWNKNNELIDCSQEVVRLFELSSKQEYMDRFSELSPVYQSHGTASQLLAHEAVKKAFDEGYYRFEWMHQKLNGEPIPCEITLVRLKHRGNNIVVGYTRDLREQKKLLKEIRDKNEELKNLAHWYENILDTIPFPLSVTDADMNWTFINKATENYLEVKRDDILGLPCDNWRADICHTDRCGIYRIKHGLKQTHFKQRGSSFQVDGDILKDLNGKTEGYVEVVQDITQLELTTKRQAEAEAANRAKSDFLARVSHEVRTPMNAILGITEIQLQNEDLPEDTEDALGKIYNSGYLLLGIINDILDLSKIEAGKLELVPVNYDVPSLINDTVHLNIMRFDSKSIEFMLELDENIPVTLFGDELRIKQILNNLLSNAYKYTDSGEVTLSVCTEQKQGQVMLVFRVNDTGQGMTPDQVDKLFDEYSRFNIEANRTTEGTGLGMSITRHLIHMMNGEITVESEPGKGSTFIVRLPQKKVDDEVFGKGVIENLKQFRSGKMSQLKKAPQIVREYMPYGKVLVVDDVETNLYVARGLMSPYGLTIDSVSSGFEAVEKIQEGAVYDVIFMDHFMPKKDGIETTKDIRALGYISPIIALTANALAGQAEMFIANGFDGYISKPIDIRQLNDILNKLVRNKYPEDVVEAARQLKERQNKNTAENPRHISAELADIFVRDAEKAVTVLEAIHKKQNAYGVEDIPLYIINVHAMRGALANIGETELSGMAAKLEEAGRTGNTALLSGETPMFLSVLQAVIKRIEHKREDNTDERVTQEDKDYLYEKLLVLQEACAGYDKKAAKEALVALNKKSWPRIVKKQLNIIAEHLLHSDFEGASSAAGRVDCG